MRSIFLSLSLLTCLLQNLIAAPIDLNPTISEVTVYRNGAKISSIATAKIPAGKSEVVFENLSPYFNANSLQVKIKGSATLVSAVFRLKTPGPAPENPRAGILRDSLIALGDDLVRINNEREVLSEENTLINETTKRIGVTPTGLSTTLSVAELKELSAYYRQRLLEIKARLLDLVIKERKINERYQKTSTELNLLNPNTGNSTGEIALKLEAAAGQSVEITCTYLVDQAGWTPLYDLRSDGLDKPLHLIYKANVYNQTGFDWKNVILHLSSALPLANNNRPILTPIFVDFRPAYVYRDELDDQKPATYQMTQSTNLALEKSKDQLGGRVDINRAGNGPLDWAGETPEEAPENDFLSAFDLDKPQDILADGKENIVTVDEQDIPVTYEYHTVPKLDPSVFLLAKMTNYGKYNLLPGTANIFYQETFVGQSVINPKVISDTLLLSLGRDEQLTVKRVQPQDFTERKKVFDKDIKENYTYEITVKNNKSVPVKVNILDQIPVSKQEDIKVELEEKGGAKYTEEYGKLSWDLEIPAGQNKRVRFTYTVKYPKSKPVAIVKG